MDSDVKIKLIQMSMDLIINQGLPALTTFVNLLQNSDEEVTVEKINILKGELDAQDYF